MSVVPYTSSDLGKKEQVKQMFNSIAKRYDFLNHFLSLGIDHLWRRKAINYLRTFEPKQILDVATGTGDFAIEALKINPDRVIGVDISDQMLEFGKTKIKTKKLDSRIELQLGDSENLSFATDSFDAILCAFGVRNFENLDKGLQEMNRVLKPNGQLVILEFSKPLSFIQPIYAFYFKYITPTIGKYISKSKEAYTYLPESVNAFPYGKAFTDILQKNGYVNCKVDKLSFGIASMYTATK